MTGPAGLVLLCSLRCAAPSLVVLLLPTTRRVLSEGSEKLAVASALLRHHVQLQAASGGAPPRPSSALGLLGRLVEEAGRQASADSYEVGGSARRWGCCCCWRRRLALLACGCGRCGKEEGCIIIHVSATEPEGTHLAHTLRACIHPPPPHTLPPVPSPPSARRC